MAVELALLSPVLLLLMVGVFDFGSALNERMRLGNAARSGAQYALVDSSNLAAAQQAALDATGLDSGLVTVAASIFCECSDGSSVACSDTCPTGLDRRRFALVTVQEDYETLFSYPGIGNPISLSGSATLRLE